MSIQETAQLVNDFKSQIDTPGPKGNELLNKLKLALAIFSFPDANKSQQEVTQQLLLCREILECAALYAVTNQDIPSFERYFAQLKTYYHDYASKLPASQQELPLTGLNLLRLLSKNYLAEFHTELELIPFEKQSNVYIKHPVQLEQYMMEGSYNKVLKATSDVPSKYFSFFMGLLMNTVRDQIASCSEAAYRNVSLGDAQKILAFQNADQLKQYSDSRGWKIENNTIQFKHDSANDKNDIPTLGLIQQTLQYARELERIV
eukprot:TRINITY_DN194_c0_g1_i1.p1 TRINITY_DN194_c0_g1~~TRINITY_DN194_c0_g1_i1.p1  ORF type:complete len:278 (-),score=83.42 TRINITY_DN194_c0_g1_i1:27-809(-)